MSTEMIIMMIGLGLGSHFHKALDESGKETFTKDDIIPIHAKALTDFCESFSKKKKEEEQKNKEAELGILPKSRIS